MRQQLHRHVKVDAANCRRCVGEDGDGGGGDGGDVDNKSGGGWCASGVRWCICSGYLHVP